MRAGAAASIAPGAHAATPARAAIPGAAARLALGAGGLSVLALVSLAAVAGVLGTVSAGGALAPGQGDPAGASAFAQQDIPAEYLRLYERAAARFGIDWAVLAGIGRVECDHGRDADPSCRQEGAVNSAGAGGPMQFLASTWAAYGIDGNGDGRADRWEAADAIFAAARYLHASGAPGDYRRALLAYNHAVWYVQEVERWAARYRAPVGESAQLVSVQAGSSSLAAETNTPVRFVAGGEARLMAGDGHVALVPLLAPAVVQAMLIAGNELQALPYGPAGHPDPRGAPEEDCSSTVNYVLYRSGVRPIAEVLRQNPLAQDYLGWGAPGRGRWVTIYATDLPTPHTFMTIAGLRLDTSHDGTDTGPNRYEDGPRWRILDQIPTWAHWSVRHPPGL